MNCSSFRQEREGAGSGVSVDTIAAQIIRRFECFGINPYRCNIELHSSGVRNGEEKFRAGDHIPGTVDVREAPLRFTDPQFDFTARTTVKKEKQKRTSCGKTGEDRKKKFNTFFCHLSIYFIPFFEESYVN